LQGTDSISGEEQKIPNFFFSWFSSYFFRIILEQIF
jgi:hypothetical protein